MTFQRTSEGLPQSKHDGTFGPLLGHELPSGKYGWRCSWHWPKCENNSTTAYTLNNWRFGLCDEHVQAQKERNAVREAMTPEMIDFFMNVMDLAWASTRDWASDCQLGVMTITITVTEGDPDAEPRLLELPDLANGLSLLAVEQAEDRWFNCQQDNQDVIKLQTALAEGSDDYDWEHLRTMDGIVQMAMFGKIVYG